MATIQLSQGRFVRAIVESDHGKLLSLGAGDEALLVALVYDDANLGLVLMAMERAARQVETILGGGGGERTLDRSGSRRHRRVGGSPGWSPRDTPRSSTRSQNSSVAR